MGGIHLFKRARASILNPLVFTSKEG